MSDSPKRYTVYGVYVDGDLAYVGMTGRLRNRKRQLRRRFPDGECRAFAVSDLEYARWLEGELIRELGPTHNHPSYAGVGPFTDEHRRRIGAGHRGKIITKEHRRKLRAANTGKKRGPHSGESRAKMSAAMKGNKHFAGRKHSEETIQKMSDARKRWWEARRAK